MKKYIVMIIAVWIASILFLLAYAPKSDGSYMLEINRLHEGAMTLAESDAIESVESVDISQLSPQQKQAFFVGTEHSVILPAAESDIFVRYTVKSQKQNPLPTIIFTSLTPLTALFALIKTQVDILKPLRAMSEIPGQLAKGHFQYRAPQIKGKTFHKFLWGLDMLRAKLEEQKNINLGFEKERKTLVASLSHDIKTPLSSIKTYSTAIKDGVYGTQEEMQDALSIIIEKTTKIERLTDELLSSSVNAIEEIIVDATGHYISELHGAINAAVRNRISLLKMEYRVEPPPSNTIVLADMDRFMEVCDNIVENAIKYGNLGNISVRFSNEEQCTLISFENTGGHIPEAELKHVFTSYYRGSNAGIVPGHGLGLYIAGKIMRAMEGDIFAENTSVGVKVVLVVKQI